MGDPYTKLPTGATVSQMSRTVYNDTIDMLSWWRSHVRSGPGRSGSIDYNQAVFLAKNGVGSALPAYSVVGIDGPLFEPTDNLAEFLNKTVLSIVEPDIDAHEAAFGVTLDICGTGEITRVCVSGMTPVLLSVGAEGDTSAGIVDGAVTHLSTGGQGVPILWKDAAENEDGNGRRWGLVLLGGSGASIHLGKLDADLAYNDTVGVTVSIWSDDLSEDTGDNIENVLPLWTMTTGTIASGSKVKIEKIKGRWYVTAAPCDEEI